MMGRPPRILPTSKVPGGFAVVALSLLTACRQALPMAPSDLTTGITIYEHANFQGESAHVTRDISDLRDVRGPCEHERTTTLPNGDISFTTVRNWNDCISSIGVAPGWRATVYRGTGFDGQSLDVTGDVANLQLVQGTCSHDGLNDCISSIRPRQQ